MNYHSKAQEKWRRFVHASLALEKVLYDNLHPEWYPYITSSVKTVSLLSAWALVRQLQKSSRIMCNICNAKCPLFSKIPMFQTLCIVTVVWQHTQQCSRPSDPSKAMDAQTQRLPCWQRTVTLSSWLSGRGMSGRNLLCIQLRGVQTSQCRRMRRLVHYKTWHSVSKCAR